jgi:hypothetical protein
MRLAVALTTAVILDGCAFHPDRQWQFLDRRDGSSKLVFDSHTVRRLIAEQETRDQGGANPYDAEGRLQFFNAVRDQPGVVVLESPYARELELSKAHCEPNSSSPPGRLARIRITTGPLKGKEGWVCQHHDIAPTLAMP